MKPVLRAIPPLLAVVTTMLALALLVLPSPEGLPTEAARALGLVIFAIGLWATAVVPEVLTALAFLLFAVLFSVAPNPVIFSGFASTAIWLVFGGLFIGAAVQRTGLGPVIAEVLVRHLGTSYLTMLSAIAVTCIGLSFLMPSVMGRVLLLVPIVTALSDRIGFPPGSRGRIGLVMVTLLATYMPSCAILPSNVPNMVLAGAAETIHGVSLTYGSYLLLHFPILGLFKTVLIVLLVWVLFRDEPREVPEESGSVAIPRQARTLLVILLVALGFWITDFLHHVSPAWIAMAAAIVLLIPRVGLLPIESFSQGINFAPFFFVAAILAVGAIVNQSGLGEISGRALLDVLELSPGADFRNFMTLSLAWTLLAMLFTIGGLPAILTPLAGEVAGAAGMSLQAVLMSEVIGYSTVVLPYQMAPLIVGIAIGGVRVGECARVMLPLTALTFLLVLPLNFLWWQYLGYFGG